MAADSARSAHLILAGVALRNMEAGRVRSRRKSTQAKSAFPAFRWPCLPASCLLPDHFLLRMNESYHAAEARRICHRLHPQGTVKWMGSHWPLCTLGVSHHLASNLGREIYSATKCDRSRRHQTRSNRPSHPKAHPACGDWAGLRGHIVHNPS